MGNTLKIELTREEVEILLTVLQVDVRRLERLETEFRSKGNLSKSTTCQNFITQRIKLYHKIDKAQ